MFKKFLKIFAIVFTCLFFIDWFLGVLRFSVEIGQSLFDALNIPFGILANNLEEYASSQLPGSHLYNNEYFHMIMFVSMVFLQALLFSVIFWYGRIFWRKIRLWTTNVSEKRAQNHDQNLKYSLE